MYLHVHIIDGVPDILKHGLERHEQISILESVIDTEKIRSRSYLIRYS